MKPELVCDGAPFGEGPVWCPDGTLVITHIAPGSLRRIWPDSGRSEVFATTAGGCNAAQLTTDGGFVVTQNGGIDFSPFAGVLGMNPDDVPAPNRGTPGLQRALPSGELIYLADSGFQSPNDLIVAADGTIYFTDPPQLHGGATGEPNGRLWAYAPNGEVRQIAEGFSYDNGVALSPEGRLLIVEASGLMWIDDDGSREWLVEELPGGNQGDGFCFDEDGRIYVCCPIDHCVRVLEPSGKQVEVIEVGEGGVVTNICFGGSDRRTLYTTELWPGRVLAIEGLPTPGLPLTPWPVPE
jgi:gluconolactonase